MRQEGDLFACSRALSKLANTINTNLYKNSLYGLFQIYITIPFYLALGNH